MATTVPSRSRPLYTSPKLPAPTRLASAKFLVACASSSSENCLAPWNSGADEVRPNRPHSADQQAITRKLPRRDEICRRSTCMNCRVTYPAWEEPRTSRCRSSGHAVPCAAAGRATPRPGLPPAATRRRRPQCQLPPGLAMPSGRPGHRTCKETCKPRSSSQRGSESSQLKYIDRETCGKEYKIKYHLTVTDESYEPRNEQGLL